jgi:hypothetical protein
VHISRDVTFNETELAESKDVRNPSQGVTALIIIANDISITPDTIKVTDKNVENGPVTGRTRKVTNKNKLFKKVFQETVETTEALIKFVSVIVSPRDPNIVYEELYEKNPPLPKAMITKLIIHNENKPLYEIAIAGSEAFQWRQRMKEEFNRILEFGIWDLILRSAKGVKIFTLK